MEPAETMTASPATALGRESVAVRTRRLAAARRRATALLAAATALFVAVTAIGVHGTFLGYVQAGAEAAMVGGVADWFAVTALFRHPLGLPIPHTALIGEGTGQAVAGLMDRLAQDRKSARSGRDARRDEPGEPPDAADAEGAPETG